MFPVPRAVGGVAKLRANSGAGSEEEGHQEHASDEFGAQDVEATITSSIDMHIMPVAAMGPGSSKLGIELQGLLRQRRFECRDRGTVR